MSGYWQRTEDTSRLFSVNPPPPAQAAQAEASLGTKVKQWLSGPVGQICAATAFGVVCYIVGGQGGSKTRRNRKSVRKSRRSKRGGAAAPNAARAPAAPGAHTRENAEQAMKVHCQANRIDMEAFFMGVMNNDYHLKTNPRLNTKGLQNPCIVGNFVFRARGHRDYYLEARPKTAADTPAALDAMRVGAPGVTDNVYIDQANDANYVVVSSMSDR